MTRFPAFLRLAVAGIAFSALHMQSKPEKYAALIGVLKKSLYYLAKRGNQIKILKISVIFALSSVEGNERRYFTKCRPQSWQKNIFLRRGK